METADYAAAEKKDFFISYTSSDQQWAQWIAYELEDAGYSTVMQAWDFHSSGNFVLEMHRALLNCDRTISVLSPAYERSGFSQAEWAAAFKEDPTGENGKLIPIRIEDYEPGGLLGPIVYIDLVGVDEDEAKERLRSEVSAICEGGRRKPKSPPEFPGVGPSQVDARFPGDLPRIWNLPIRMRRFSGRSALMSDLANALGTDRVCVLHGLSGVGKTRAALEYAYRTGSPQRVVWRVRAREEPVARGDIADLGEALGLPASRSASRDEVFASTIGWLAQNDGWLLILDDATSANDIANLIPGGQGGQILITSQAAAGWAAIATPIEVSVLEEAEADQFLADRIGGSPDSEIRSLSQDLGALPLALEQAAAYMEATGIDVETYRDRLRQSAPELLDKGGPIDHEETVARTWRLAMEEIGTHDGAADVLELSSLLAPDWIPRGLFDGEDLRFEGPQKLTPLDLDGAIAELGRFSLVTLDSESISVHRLVQWAARQALEPGILLTRVKEAGCMLIECWPEESGRDPSEWPGCAALASHLEAFAERAVEIDPDGKALPAVSLMSVGIYLRTRGDYGSAADLLERALTIVEGCDEALERELMVNLLGETGIALSMLGNHQRALELQERALELVDSLGLASTTEGGAAFSLAGISFCEAGQDRRSLKLHERSLAIFREESPPSVHKIGSALGNLGNLARRLGDLKAARSYQTESIELLEAEHGPDHHEVGIALSGLGRVERSAGNLKTALDLLSRAHEIFEAEMGPESLEVARTCHDRCGVNAELGNFKAARNDLERALTIYRKNGDPWDPRLLAPLGDLTRLCIELGDEAGARAATAEAAAISAHHNAPKS